MREQLNMDHTRILVLYNMNNNIFPAELLCRQLWLTRFCLLLSVPSWYRPFQNSGNFWQNIEREMSAASGLHYCRRDAQRSNNFIIIIALYSHFTAFFLIPDFVGG